MKVYQLHLDGKNRAHHNFKTADEALIHRDRLIRYTKDRVSEGRIGFRQYLEEAKKLELVELDINNKNHMFSVVESEPGCSSIIRTYYDKSKALDLLNKLEESSDRNYSIMESMINGNESTHNTRKGRDGRPSGRKTVQGSKLS